MIQPVLDGLGAILSFFYSLVPNYGVAIILFTLGVRLLLLPLGIKQVRSMQAMQAIQPKLKQIQQKYKGNRQKISEETLALYKEHGVNPLGGCLPIVAQMPILFALFAVLQFPTGLTHIPHNEADPRLGAPGDSALYLALTDEDNPPKFVGANLLCNATQAGRRVQVETDRVPDAPDVLDCGNSIPVRIPYYLLAVAMIGTTYYQQRQTQRANPVPNPQQQALTRIMPILFGVWGFVFPAGLVLYWTTANLVQIGQQHFLLRARHVEPAPPATRSRAGGKATGGKAGPTKRAPGSGDGTRPSRATPSTARSSKSSSSRTGGNAAGARRSSAGAKSGGTKGSIGGASRGGQARSQPPGTRSGGSGNKSTGGTDGSGGKKRDKR